MRLLACFQRAGTGSFGGLLQAFFVGGFVQPDTAAGYFSDRGGDLIHWTIRMDHSPGSAF